MNGTSEPTEKGWMITYTGRKFYPFDPRPEDINIFDIAHHLSNICRYTGAVSKFYSVAQHCVMGSHICTGNPFRFLMHDATEAYLVDVPRPIKHAIEFKTYREVEHRLEKVLLPIFGITNIEMPPDVARVDFFMCVWEGVSLMPMVPDSHWGKYRDEVDGWPGIDPWLPEVAESKFLDRFYELYRDRKMGLR